MNVGENYNVQATNCNNPCPNFLTLLKDLQDLYEGRDVQSAFDAPHNVDEQQQDKAQWQSAPLNLPWAQPANFHELLKNVNLPQEELLETFSSIHQALEEMEIDIQGAFDSAVRDTCSVDLNSEMISGGTTSSVEQCTGGSSRAGTEELVKAVNHVQSLVEACYVEQQIRILRDQESSLEAELEHAKRRCSQVLEEKEAARSQWSKLKTRLHID